MVTTTYLMEAKENYPSDVAAYLDANDAFLNVYRYDQLLLGLSFDRARRKIMWGGMVWIGSTQTITNPTGHTLWDGQATMAPTDVYDQDVQRSFAVIEKDIDTGVVTAYPAYDATKIVPSGIGGGDGTWRRMISDLRANENFPLLIDPWTGNAWFHTESCELHCLPRAGSFGQFISPIFPTGDSVDPVMPKGFNSSWTFGFEDGDNPGWTYDKLHLVPRVVTAAETTADYKLVYASYNFPIARATSFYRLVVSPAGNLYAFGNSTSGANPYFLWKFAPPTLGGYPATGGAWTNETPWGSTGPNASTSGYTTRTSFNVNRNLAFSLYTDNQFALISQLFPGDKAGGTDADYRLDVTYFDIAAGTAVTHTGVVTAYMDADWSPVASLADAAWLIDTTEPTQEVDNDLDQSSYDHTSTTPSLDYRKRWIYFVAYPVTAGVAGSNAQNVLVQYNFDPTGAPTVERLIPEGTTWDPLYPTYAASLGVPEVVWYSLSGGNNEFNTGYDKGIFDPETNAFWWSGDTARFWPFDPAFATREAASGSNGAHPPLMRLSFSETFVGPRCIVQSLILNLPELPDVLDENGDSVSEEDEGEGEGSGGGGDSGGDDSGGGDVGAGEDLGALTPVVFDRPGFASFVNIGGWDQTIAQFTANAALMTHVTLSLPDWIEGPGSRLSVLDAIHAAGLKGAMAAGRLYSGTSWSDPSVAQVFEWSYNPAEVIDHACMQGGGILQLPDESDLYWNAGAGAVAYPWSTPTATGQIVTDWKAGHSGNLGGLPVYHNLLSASQLYTNYDVNAPFLNDVNLFATSADQYPITYFVAQSVLVGLADWSGPQAEFTTGATGMTTWLNKFGPHPSGATGQLGKPHFEALSMCRQADTGHHLTAAEQDVLAWSIIIMGGDGWTQFTTSFITDGDPQGTGRDRWSPSSSGLPGGMKAWMATAIARMALIESKGCLFRDTEHGGGRSWFRIRRSAPATAPGSANLGDRGPPNGEAITWASPASVHFLPGGWQAIRMWNEAKTQSWYLLQNIVAFGSSRTLTLASDDPWHDALNGKTHGPGEVVFYNSDGTVVSGWV